jgi:hypothetical protein
MLDPWIIEEIRRREEEQRQRDRQPAVIELPLHQPVNDRDRGSTKKEDDGQPRGIAIIEL